jgi:4-hydroxybenzoate polyprenyltransferase
MWFLDLIRWKNLLIILLMQGLVYFFLCQDAGYSDNQNFQNLVLVWVATVSITAAGNIVNDIRDREIDALNKPGKNAVGVQISLRNAYILYVVLNLLGILLAFLLRSEFGILSLGTAILLALYSLKLKCVPIAGNLSVAICMGLSVWVVSYATEFCVESSLFIFIMFAAITGLVREMVKDIEDIEGDSAAGCKTLPVAAGVLFSKSLAAAVQFFGSIIIAAGAYYLVHEKPLWHLVYFGLAVVLPMLILFIMITLAKQKADYSRISTGLKIIMVTGLLYLPLAYYL